MMRGDSSCRAEQPKGTRFKQAVCAGLLLDFIDLFADCAIGFEHTRHGKRFVCRSANKGISEFPQNAFDGIVVNMRVSSRQIAQRLLYAIWL